MINSLLAGSALAFVVFNPETAWPAPPPASAPAPVKVAAPPTKIELTVKVGTEKRVHQVVLSDESCGTVHAKSRDFEDEIRVCSVTSRNGTRVEASWKIREKVTEYHVTYTAAVARGGTVDAFAHGATFTLAMK